MHVLMTLALFLLGVNLAYLRFGPEGFRTRIRREAEATGREDQPPSVLNEYRRFAYWAMLVIDSKEYSGNLSEKEAEIQRYNLVREKLSFMIKYVAMPIFQNKPEASDKQKRPPKIVGSNDPDHQLTKDQLYSRSMVVVGSVSVWALSLMMAFNSTIESTGLLAALVVAANICLSGSIFIVLLGESYVRSATKMIKEDVKQMADVEQDAVASSQLVSDEEVPSQAVSPNS